MSGTTFPLSVLADFSRESYAKGHADGLQAARDAVAALTICNCDTDWESGEHQDWCVVPLVFAAIDALRGDTGNRIGQDATDSLDESHVDWCRDLYCGGCEEVHDDPCDCDKCRGKA